MSSYHELMVHQANQDRNRLASLNLSAGVLREVSLADVEYHLSARRSELLTSRIGHARNFLAAILAGLWPVRRYLLFPHPKAKS
jgi:hypothetical protein